MKKEIFTVIFDFDGVIVDSGGGICNAVNYMLKKYDRETLPNSMIISYVGYGARYLLEKSFPDFDADKIDKILPEYVEYYWSNPLVETFLYEGVKDMLKTLDDSGINCAVVTNKPEDIARKILKALDVEGYFKMVIGPESVTAMKPDPEGLLKVLDSYKTEGSKAVMVGDSYTDIIAGRRAGTLTCGATYGLGDVKKLLEENPDFTIDKIEGLLEYIEL